MIRTLSEILVTTFVVCLFSFIGTMGYVVIRALKECLEKVP